MTSTFTDRHLLSFELLQIGQRALREGRRLDARRHFQAAVAANPLDARAWLELARLSSPVARAFYLVEAFDLNPANRSVLEELRLAYRFVVRLTTGAASPAPQPSDTKSLGDTSRLPSEARASPTLLELIHARTAELQQELRRAGREVALAFAALARPLLRRVQERISPFLPRLSLAAEAQPLRLYTLPGAGLWIVAGLLGASLVTTLSAAGGWRRPAPAAVSLGAARKAGLTPTPTITLTPTIMPSPYPTVMTATPIPSATPTNTPEPLLRWAPELEVNGWTYEKGVCEGPFAGPVGTAAFIWPAGNHYLSGYNFSLRWHPGIDIATQLGDPIYAADAGVVVFAGWNSQGYGNLVVLDHGNGWETLYAHLSQINVDCGQAVEQGSVIGLAGSTGNSTGPHLHFEILNDAYGRVNPWWYLP
jgi:murein DD-endopeptidase MepM/ murein hydrolase activator NlpD